MRVQSWATIYLRSFLRPGLSSGPFLMVTLVSKHVGVECARAGLRPGRNPAPTLYDAVQSEMIRAGLDEQRYGDETPP
jgi:hypothetical protein